MSEETESQPLEDQPEVEETTEATPQPVAPVFTQEQLNAIVAKEVAKAKRQAKKAQPQPQNAPPAPSTVSDDPPEWAASLIQSNANMAAKIEASENAAAFAKATAGVSLSEDDAAMAETLFSANRAQFDTFIKGKLAPDQPPEAKGPGFNSPGAPAATPRATDMSDPTTWTKDEIAAQLKDGTFMDNVKSHRRGLSGGGAFFPARDPMKKGRGN